MAFKNINSYFMKASLFILIIISCISCNKKDKENTDNTFFIEMDNFNNDSLKQSVSENIFGKASFYKNGKLEILSLNYITEEYENMHYFKRVEDIKKDIEDNTKKIEVEFIGNYSEDSISFSLKKYKYYNKEWIKISDMGFIKATNTYKKAKTMALSEYGKHIVNTIVNYSYN